jgi:hypothetical protein
VLARVVENWLTNTGERGYQTAFAQLLLSEGCTVLHAPVHHPFEHGKDLIALSSDGQLWAYQLKGGDLGLADLEKVQGQLFALAGTAVTYPGIEPPRPPDRVFLVSNGSLSPPARDRLRSFNDANRQRNMPAIEVVEKDQLVGRFVAAHGAYLPSELEELSDVLAMVLADGRGPFPTNDYARTVRSVLERAGSSGVSSELRKAISSLTIITAYATGAWQRAENHLGVAEGWLTLALLILRVAEKYEAPDEEWISSFSLARDSARQSLGSLLKEAAGAEDLVIPHVLDGLIYPVRAAIVCGYCAALYLSERETIDGENCADLTKSLLLRELEYIQIGSEAGAPLLLMVATALEVLGEPLAAWEIVFQWAKSLVTANQPGSNDALPDPYHSLQEVLLQNIGADTAISEEHFAGEAYTLHVALDWLTRRNGRALVEKLWPDVTRVHFVEYRPMPPFNLMADYDSEGEQETWAPAMPASWGELRREALTLSETELPQVLWQHLYILPYLPLIFPFRLTRSISKALDYMVTGSCQVTLMDGSTAGIQDDVSADE